MLYERILLKIKQNLLLNLRSLVTPQRNIFLIDGSENAKLSNFYRIDIKEPSVLIELS